MLRTIYFIGLLLGFCLLLCNEVQAEENHGLSSEDVRFLMEEALEDEMRISPAVLASLVERMASSVEKRSEVNRGLSSDDLRFLEEAALNDEMRISPALLASLAVRTDSLENEDFRNEDTESIRQHPGIQRRR